MTEAEWLACADLARLIKSQKESGRDRKLRLFACGCARRIWDQLSSETARLAVALSERFADGATDRTELDEMYHSTMIAWGVSGNAWERIITTGMAVLIPDASSAALHTSSHTPEVGVPKGTPSRKSAMAVQRTANLVSFRDIFGNPFRTVSADPSWLTSDVLALATGIYQDRAFDRMAILADALQDAGCDNDDILNHCRQPGEHVRGCWVVDLVLGKS